MARQRYIQDPVTLKLVPAEDYKPRTQAGFFIMDDLKPYKSMITGEIIQGRAQHRAHLRQHGCIEVGNEKLTPHKTINPSRDDYRRSVAAVMSSKGF